MLRGTDMGSHLDEELRKVQPLVSGMPALGTRAWVFPGNAAIDISARETLREKCVVYQFLYLY